MGSYKKIGLSHEMGLIDTPPLAQIPVIHTAVLLSPKKKKATLSLASTLFCYVSNIAVCIFFTRL